jgi:uncharacterized protein YhfF
MPLQSSGLAEHLRWSVFGQLAVDQPSYRVAHNASVSAMWNAYLDSLQDASEALERGCDSYYFCDNQHDADNCGALVLAGCKQASAAALWVYELEQAALPAAGDYAVVTNWAGEALCVIRTTSVETIPFDQVSEAFAAAEAEGDGSLAWWRETHRAAFTRELACWGREPAADMPVVCERFETLFPPAR